MTRPLAPSSVETLPASLADNPRLSRWLSFHPDGYVLVHTGKVELGQGIVTALVQIVADELEVSPQRIRVAAANTTEAPDEGYTAGSLSVQHSGAALRQVCAEVQAVCRTAAAVALGSDEGALRLVDGAFAASGRTVSYWDLPTAELLDRDADGRTTPKMTADYRHVGQSLPRVDFSAKLTGTPCYLGDLVLPGQLHARVVRPPSRGARLHAANTSRATALAGVHRVVVLEDFLAVLAEREETAIHAAELLAADSDWQEHDSLPDDAALDAFLSAAPAETETLFERDDDPRDVLPARTVTATYTRPYLAHGSIATSTALALWHDGTLQVWTSSQGIYHLRAAIGTALGLPAAAIVVQHMESAGCYGHNGADDAAYDAAVLAQVVPGRPVRVVWSRQDELAWSPLGPAMRVALTAEVDPAGYVRSWRHEIWSNGHTSRPGSVSPPSLLTYAHQHPAESQPIAADPSLERGGGSARNAVAGYDFPRHVVRTHRLSTMPLRTSAMRALGAHLNVFAIESLMDELAGGSGQDPLEYRLAQLGDPRGRRVLQVAAERAGWGGVLATPGSGRGIGYARYKGVGAYCAVVAELEAVSSVRVRRLTLAVDVGTAINPDGVANQIEGGAIQSLSWTLRERIRFDRRRVTSDTWESYPILKFSDIPAVDVVVLPSDEPSVGAGEASVGPTAAALGNAIAAAVGVRVRDMPLTSEAIVAAIEAG